MKKILVKIENKKVFYFSLALILYEIMYWIIMLTTNSNLLNTYFIPDQHDTSMDYFNMLANMQYDTPYANHSNYPAMCFLFWKLFYFLLPQMDNTVDGFFLRNYMPAQLGYILLMILTIILLWELFNSFRVGGKIENKLLSIGLLLSGPMIFAFERGNIIILAFLFLVIFIRYYDSDNKYLRTFAYISLSISASLKLYPAFFGILVLQKKRYKEAGLLVMLGILFFILPFFAFEGLQSLKDMIYGMFLATSEQIKLGLGLNYSFSNLIKISGRIFHLEIENISVCLRIFSLVYCAFIYFATSKNWQKVFILSLVCTWIPDVSYQYLLILFIIPFLFYLIEEKVNESYFNNLYGALFVVILIPIALPSIDSLGIYYFSLALPTIIINMALLLVSLMILLESLGKMKKKYSNKI